MARVVRLRALTWGTFILGLFVFTGCGGYAADSKAFRKALSRGKPANALSKVNEALGVDEAHQMPSEPKEDTALLLLERATVLQAMGRYKDSARDFQAADAKLDVLDLTNDTAGNISKYIFSDDATVYKAPPHEKLLLNTMNMINYLARGDVSGAKVEARRMVINRKYLKGEGEEDRRSMMALSSYLAGFAFEHAKQSPQAMRHYADAWEGGEQPTLKAAIQALHVRTGASDSRLKAVIVEGQEAVDTTGTTDLLVIIQTGMAPYRYPNHIPIGRALTMSNRGRRRLSDKERRRANAMAVKGALTWVNFPSLKKVKGGHSVKSVRVGKTIIPSGLALDVTNRVEDEFDRWAPGLMAAAISRTIVRAVAGEASKAAAKGNGKAGLAGLLVGLAVEGAMAAADTPDTRGWVTLPGSFYLARAQVAAGKQTVTVSYNGKTRKMPVDLKPGGWKVLNFSALR